ncbi:MAG: hypothetical protein ABIP94_11635 [Planctomycetota bacterium]
MREANELAAWLEHGFRFDVVAHSMGGLVARYFLQFGTADLPADGSLPMVTWAGAEQIDRLVLVGTPNLGSMEALQTLVQGFTPGRFLPLYDAAVLGTMPSIYQLLPRSGQGLVLDTYGKPLDIDIYDPAQWIRNGWGLASPGTERYLQWLLPDEPDPAARRARANEVLAANLDRARRFHAALDQDPQVPCPAELRLFAADTIPTLARTRLVATDGRLVPQLDGDSLREFGDGTVPRFSALADRNVGGRLGGWLDSPVRWHGVTFLPDDHIGLTRNPVFTANLLFYLLEQPPRQRATGQMWQARDIWHGNSLAGLRDVQRTPVPFAPGHETRRRASPAAADTARSVCESPFWPGTPLRTAGGTTTLPALARVCRAPPKLLSRSPYHVLLKSKRVHVQQA